MWHLSQVFGGDKTNEEICDADIVSSIEFNEDGDCLATGDRGGRVVLFYKDPTKDENGKTKIEYRFFCEFQSHEPEFDYLKSVEIEGKINRIKFLPQQNDSMLLLTTNDRTIKLWKVFNKIVRPSSSKTTLARLRTVYTGAHTFSINSISPSSDMESFISSDDLRVNLWNFGVTDTSMTVVDMKPDVMEDLAEVITCANFHSTNPSVFLYGSSKGIIRVSDLRISPLCDKPASSLDNSDDREAKSFFSEIVSSVSDAKFFPDGRHVLARDYLTVKIWDLAQPRSPVQIIPIHEHLRSALCDLYENDSIFDKFEVSCNRAGTKIATGSYHRYMHIYDMANPNSNSLSSDINYPMKFDHVTLQANRLHPRPVRRKPAVKSDFDDEQTLFDFEETNSEMIDFSRKVQSVAFHPTDNIVFATVLNNLFIFSD